MSITYPSSTVPSSTIPSITISTTPIVRSMSNGQVDTRRTPIARNRGNPLVGVIARMVAGLLGALLGLAIGLVSAGFDTTRLLLAVGAAALGLGWLIALVTSAPIISRFGR